MRRFLTVLVVASITCGSSLFWLYDGDMGQVHPVLGALDAAQISALLGRAPDGTPDGEDRVKGAGHVQKPEER